MEKPILVETFISEEPLWGWARRTPSTIAFNIHPHNPKWRRRITVMHELLHIREYENEVSEEHIVLHRLSIFLTIALPSCETRTGSFDDVTPQNFLLMFKDSTIFSQYDMVVTVLRYIDILGQMRKLLI